MDGLWANSLAISCTGDAHALRRAKVGPQRKVQMGAWGLRPRTTSFRFQLPCPPPAHHLLQVLKLVAQGFLVFSFVQNFVEL